MPVWLCKLINYFELKLMKGKIVFSMHPLSLPTQRCPLLMSLSLFKITSECLSILLCTVWKQIEGFATNHRINYCDTVAAVLRSQRAHIHTSTYKTLCIECAPFVQTVCYAQIPIAMRFWNWRVCVQVSVLFDDFDDNTTHAFRSCVSLDEDWFDCETWARLSANRTR